MLSILPSVVSGGLLGSAFNRVCGKGSQLMEYGTLYGVTQGVMYAVILDRSEGVRHKMAPRKFVMTQLVLLLGATYGVKKVMEWKWEFSPSLSLQIFFVGGYICYHNLSLGVER